MNIRLSEQAVEALTDAPRHVRTAFEKQLHFWPPTYIIHRYEPRTVMHRATSGRRA
jgi:hypothetical protein